LHVFSQIHFDENCWEELREDGKRKLKWGAVPLHLTLPPQQSVSPKQHPYSFDHPYCSGIFLKRREPFVNLINSNVKPAEHSYSKEVSFKVLMAGVFEHG